MHNVHEAVCTELERSRAPLRYRTHHTSTERIHVSQRETRQNLAALNFLVDCRSSSGMGRPSECFLLSTVYQVSLWSCGSQRDGTCGPNNAGTQKFRRQLSVLLTTETNVLHMNANSKRLSELLITLQAEIGE